MDEELEEMFDNETDMIVFDFVGEMFESHAMITGPLTRDAEWMCQFDVKPYDC